MKMTSNVKFAPSPAQGYFKIAFVAVLSNYQDSKLTENQP